MPIHYIYFFKVAFVKKWSVVYALGQYEAYFLKTCPPSALFCGKAVNTLSKLLIVNGKQSYHQGENHLK